MGKGKVEPLALVHLLQRMRHRADLVQNTITAVIDHQDSGLCAVCSSRQAEAADIDMRAESAFDDGGDLGEEERVVLTGGSGVEVIKGRGVGAQRYTGDC